MTCGACEPTAFRQGAEVVYGYLVTDQMHSATHEARKLYFMGAQHVFSDLPQGKLSNRPGWRLLRKCLRSGDRLVLASPVALGTKPERANAHMQALEQDGIKTFILNQDYFD